MLMGIFCFVVGVIVGVVSLIFLISRNVESILEWFIDALGG